MMTRAARIFERMLMHAYAIVALRIAYVYVKDGMDFHMASFQIAQAQARALIGLASKLAGV